MLPIKRSGTAWLSVNANKECYSYLSMSKFYFEVDAELLARYYGIL